MPSDGPNPGPLGLSPRLHGGGVCRSSGEGVGLRSPFPAPTPGCHARHPEACVCVPTPFQGPHFAFVFPSCTGSAPSLVSSP